jgi:hypothetical protein
MAARHALRLAVLALGGTLALACAPAIALANTVSSSNWSGYAAHRAGVSFRRVSGSWTQPAASCSTTGRTYSSFWVGLGGFSTTAGGLEQIGSELDCNVFGQQHSSVWYELVPAPSRHIRMTVRPGDQISASVTVAGDRVSFRLVDVTRGESFARRLTTRSIDVTAADWITEAPSTCEGSGSCQTLPLTDFGSAHFTGDRAQTVSGHGGAISDPAWSRTRLVLSQSPSPFTGLDTRRTSTPTTLQRGRAFVVHYGEAALVPALRLAAADAQGAPTVEPGGARH